VDRQIWLPSSAVPTDRCRSCGKTFTRSEFKAFVDHSSRCAEEHYQDAKNETVAAKMPGLFGPDTIDHELEAYAKEHAEAILEGRKRLS
jgi:phage FluMu protein Com